MNEYDVDKNERPTVTHKIKSTKVLINPFNDIKLREHLLNKKRKKDKSEKKEKPVVKKNTALLSFGDEAEEDEQEFQAVNKVICTESHVEKLLKVAVKTR